jgi:hypothetical protein
MFKVIRRGQSWAIVRTTKTRVLNALYQPEMGVRMDGVEMSTKKFAKVYYRRGGTWLVSGYDQSGADLNDALYHMNEGYEAAR